MGEPPVDPALLSCTARMELGRWRAVQMVVFYNTHWILASNSR